MNKEQIEHEADLLVEYLLDECNLSPSQALMIIQLAQSKIKLIQDRNGNNL